MTYSGAKIYRSAKLAECEIRKSQPSQIYILTGVNKLSWMDRKTRRVTAISLDKNKIAQQIYDEMNFIYKILRNSTPEGTKIIFAPITGVWIVKYNNDDLSVPNNHQEVINIGN